MSERTARASLVLIVATLTLAAASLDLSERSGRQFWSDASTYYSMTWSLVEDFDLRYEARDLLRVERRFGSGPQGIFLKRAWGGLDWDADAGFPWLRRVQEDEKRVYFAKAFAYPIAAAPFVAAFGDRGFLVANALFLGLGLALTYAELRRRASPARALGAASGLVLATVAPLYVLWMTPELFNLGVIAAGLAAWRGGRPLLSALLLGVAIYSKPYNLFLALPLGVAPLVAREGGTFARGLGEALRRGVVLAATVIALFGLNKLVTGELNYQGGERKTFYKRYPFESPLVTFGNSGQWMTTDHLGPLVEGRDEEKESRRTGPLRALGEIRASFFRNLGYFWIGRFGGAVPYYPGAVLALLLFLVLGPRRLEGWLAAAALLVSYLFYISMIPDNWYGGGGTVGNRYFLNLLPLAAFFVPRGREWLVCGVGLLVGGVFVGPALVAPLTHSLRPGLHATRAPYRLFPAELSMLNDLSIFVEQWRKKRSVGDTEGDPWRHWPADPRAYYLYFPDDGTHGLEGEEPEQGFWLRGGRRAEVILRALEPVRQISFHVTGGPSGEDISIAVAGRNARLRLQPRETQVVRLVPGPGFAYYDTFVYVLHLRSRGDAAAKDGRSTGSFVQIALQVDKRPTSR